MKAWSRVLLLAACLWLVTQTGEAKPRSPSKKSTSGASKKADSSGSSATTCTCGQTKKGRIIGGKRTPTNQYPWAAMVVSRETLEQYCGAVIVTETVAFTAAHCSKVPEGVKISLVAGTSDAYEPKKGQIVEVEKSIEHEEFFSSEQDYKETFNDISILLLAKPLKFDANVGPICLPTGKFNLDKKWLKIVGWGRLSGTDKYTTRHLNEVDVQAKPFSFCKSKVGLKEPQKQICTLSSGKGVCWGDTGGPVLYLDPETKSYTLVGIVSFMSEECKTDEPTVSTEVSYFLPWIKSKINTLGCHKVVKEETKNKQRDKTENKETTKKKKTDTNDSKDGSKDNKKKGTSEQKKGTNEQKKGTTKKGETSKKAATTQKKKGTNQKQSGKNGKKE